MSSATQSYLKQVESIRVQQCIKISIDTEFLNANFELIKQCLIKVSDLQKQLDQNRKERETANKDIYQRLNFIQKEAADHKTLISQNAHQIKDLKGSFGDDFMKKFDDLEARAKNTQDFDTLVKKLQTLNKFVMNDTFKAYQLKTDQEIKDVNKIKDSLEKYIDHHTFKEFKTQTATEFENNKKDFNSLSEAQRDLQSQVSDIDKKATKACEDVKQNSEMVKEINFAEMQEKMRRHKDETDNKMGEMVTKLKKKVGSNDLNELEKSLVEKIDKFLVGLNSDNAGRNQTRDALLFLQKRINEIIEIITPKDDDQQDALFARKKWNCASCAKDLGKYEGKLGQFRPWAVFPARQLNPQQTGGYGYLNYIDKIAHNRGGSVDDTGLERLSKTFFDSTPRDRNSPPKKGSMTKTTNFMSAYGSNTDRPGTTLKDQYFRMDRDKAVSSRLFRVKKDKLKEQSAMLQSPSEKERVKEIN